MTLRVSAFLRGVSVIGCLTVSVRLNQVKVALWGFFVVQEMGNQNGRSSYSQESTINEPFSFAIK